MAGGTVRENALLGAALFLIAPRPTESGVEMPFVQRLTKAFGLHHLGVDRRARGYRRNAARKSLLIDVHQQIHSDARRRLIAERDHLTEFPGRIDVQKRERRLPRLKGPLRDVQQRARILAHRIEHHRIAEFADELAHNVDRLGFEPTQVHILVTPIHPMNPSPLPGSATSFRTFWKQLIFQFCKLSSYMEKLASKLRPDVFSKTGTQSSSTAPG